MGSTSYNSKLRDNRWQKMRLEVMKRDNWTCRCCGTSGDGVVFNVHHAYYESGKNPWEYPVNSLVTWCESCHATMHSVLRKINVGVCNMNQDGILQIVGLIQKPNQAVDASGICGSEFLDALKDAWPGMCDKLARIAINTGEYIKGTVPLFVDDKTITVQARNEDTAFNLNNMGQRPRVAFNQLIKRVTGRCMSVVFVSGGDV